MQIIIAITTAFSIASAFCLITFMFMPPSKILKYYCFLGMFIAELFFMLFFPELPGVTEIAHLICIQVITFSIYMNQRNYIKSSDIAFSIFLLHTIFTYVVGTPIMIVLNILFSFDKYIISLIMQIIAISIGFLLKKCKNYFFKPSNNIKILKFHLLLKILIFSIIYFAIPASVEHLSILHYMIVGLFTITTIIGFFLIKYNSKLILELESENRKSAITLNTLTIESENINKKHFEIIKLRHYYTCLFKSSVKYIEANDMLGLKNYYNDYISPINEQLLREVEAYDKINNIHVSIIKSRIIELINTVSQLPNIKFILHVYKEIYYVKMEDIDLFTVISIYIDNAVEEVKSQADGEITIEMGYVNDVLFIFQISNSLNGIESTPKLNHTHRGLDIVDEILVKYLNVFSATDVGYGSYTKTLEVNND